MKPVIIARFLFMFALVFTCPVFLLAGDGLLNNDSDSSESLSTINGEESAKNSEPADSQKTISTESADEPNLNEISNTNTIENEFTQPDRSVIDIDARVSDTESENPLGSFAFLVDKYRDPAFEKYVDLSQLKSAFIDNKSEVLVDMLLGLAEAERVLGRTHKSGVSSDEIIKRIATYVAKYGDADTVERLGNKAKEFDNKMWIETVKAANEFSSASRTPPPSFPLEQLTPSVVGRFNAIHEGVRVVELSGNSDLLATVFQEIESDNELPESAKKYLRDAAKKAKTQLDSNSKDTVTSELLEEYGSASRGICTKCAGVGKYFSFPNWKRCGRCNGTGKDDNGGIGGFTGYKTNKFDLKDNIAQGGWVVAWSDDLSETDVLQGIVAAGVSIYSGNPAAFLQWVRQLVTRTINSLARSTNRTFPQAVRRQAEQIAEEVIKMAIRGRNPKSVFRKFDTVDFKAGAIRYSGANYLAGQVVSRTWGMKPYVAFRWGNSSPIPNSDTYKIWIENPTRDSIHYKINGEKFVVESSHTRWHSRSSSSFTVEFDSSFSSGYQQKKYNLTPGSRNFFKVVGRGLDLYKK